jgi:hypothetical protein
MTILEFLDLVKKDPLKWINYCEIIISKNGCVELANPCHEKKLIEIYCKNEGITIEQFERKFPVCLSPVSFICEKYSLVSVWYNEIRCTKLNRFQKRTIELLKRNKLINQSSVVQHVYKEYTWYLENRDRFDIIIPWEK